MKSHPIALVVDFQFTIKPFSLSWPCYRIFLPLVVHFSPTAQAAITSHWALERATNLPRPITSLLSAPEAVYSLHANTEGLGNTAFGDRALLSNTTGFSNIALGLAAGANLTTVQ
jgi:hypothetical protein